MARKIKKISCLLGRKKHEVYNYLKSKFISKPYPKCIEIQYTDREKIFIGTDEYGDISISCSSDREINVVNYEENQLIINLKK